MGVSDKWWFIIGGRALLLLLWTLYVILSRFIGLGYVSWMIYVVGAPYLLLTLSSSVAVYFDRQYVTATSDWSPSRIYYLMVVPARAIGELSPFVYLYHRHQYVGVP